MKNRLKVRSIEEVKIQLKRAGIQKNNLIKNIYKEYEIYFQIVRDKIFNSVEKGIVSLYSSFYNLDTPLNPKDLNNFLNKNINFIIHTKLPLITIEQLLVEEISEHKKQLVNLDILKELEDSNENKGVDFDYENELITKEPLEFHCNNFSNSYEYYESPSDYEVTSVNLDQSGYINSLSKQKGIKKIEYENHIVESVLELIEKSNDNELSDHKRINFKVMDDYKSKDNLDLCEIIDKSFDNFLLNLSYKINLELSKINLIKKIISEDNFKYLSNNNFIIKHPYPFVITYDLNLNKLNLDDKKSSNLYLFNINNVELEFYNLDLSSCRNNINELKNKFLLLNKKQRYWEKKYFNIKNLN